MRFSIAFMAVLVSILAVLGIPTADERHQETDKEFMERICTGIYLTSDEDTLADGMGESR